MGQPRPVSGGAGILRWAGGRSPSDSSCLGAASSGLSLDVLVGGEPRAAAFRVLVESGATFHRMTPRAASREPGSAC